MPPIRRLAQSVAKAADQSKRINWHPGHMYAGMKAMIGKLNTVDCVIEVHDARIPFIGRNKEFRQHLGLVKPHILVLNKSDLADLTRWEPIKCRLQDNGDRNVLLTDLSGTSASHAYRGYDKLMNIAIKLINSADRFNRMAADHFKIMIVGIPNVGKSTLINRLRQHHLGLGGDAAHTGNEAGVTKKVNGKIKICSRPLIYSIDTPGVLETGVTKDNDKAMKLALCSTINDKALDVRLLADYLIKYLNKIGDTFYMDVLGLDKPIENVLELEPVMIKWRAKQLDREYEVSDVDMHCWRFIRLFRKGLFGKVMFD